MTITDPSEDLVFRTVAGCGAVNSASLDEALDVWSGRSEDGEGLWEFLRRRGFLSEVDAADLEADCRLVGVSDGVLDLESPGVLPSIPEGVFNGGAIWSLALPAMAFLPSLVCGRVAGVSPLSLSEIGDKSTGATRLAAMPDTDTVLFGPSRLPQVGDVLGRCRLVHHLGRGGSSLIFRAEHLKLGISVAVKVLIGGIGNVGDVFDLLVHEARLLARLNHPNILRVFDVEDEGMHPYLVLELAEGGSLEQWCHAPNLLSWEQVAGVATRVASALAAAQRLGMIHRDIKPANILMSREGDLKVADFGLGMLVGKVDPNDGFVGTLRYMSPEQIDCRTDIDQRADIYSLGATLYHLLTGEPAHRGGTPAAIVLSQHRNEVVPPHVRRPEVPKALSDLVLRMLSPNPADRPQTYEVLLTELATIIRPMPAKREKRSGLFGLFTRR